MGEGAYGGVSALGKAVNTLAVVGSYGAVEGVDLQMLGAESVKSMEHGLSVAFLSMFAIYQDAYACTVVVGVEVEEVYASYGGVGVGACGHEAELLGGEDVVGGRLHHIFGEQMSRKRSMADAVLPDGRVVFPSINIVDVVGLHGSQYHVFHICACVGMMMQKYKKNAIC